MQCPGCGSENPEGMKFCIECAAPLRKRCPSCGAGNLPRAKFCGECATPLLQDEGQKTRANPKPAKRRGTQGPHGSLPKHLKPHVQPNSQRISRGAPEAERRQLTVMFCDLVGSTPLAEKLDPEDLRQVILAYQQTCAEQVRRFDGYLARYVGDGLLVYFGYPQAHEDDAPRAIRAGLGIVQALPQLNRRLQHTGGTQPAVPLQVRIGIHTGLVVVGEMGGGDYRDPMAIVGETPNIAARLQDLAQPNTMVISEATAK